jgi:hypothetical protein
MDTLDTKSGVPSSRSLLLARFLKAQTLVMARLFADLCRKIAPDRSTGCLQRLATQMAAALRQI